MNIIQTLYIEENVDLYKNPIGWVKPEFHCMSWALSCLQLKTLYKSVTLYANKHAANFLINDLGLPYDNVVYFPESCSLPHKALWALPKLWTYSMQKEPFLHVDGDVFLFNRIDENILNNDVVGQNIEIATDYYTETQKEIEEHFLFIPDLVRREFETRIPIRAINAGVLGGNDIQLFKDYTKEAFEYINKNIDSLSLINADRFNVFFEQHLLYAMMKQRKSSTGVIFNDIIDDKGYQYVGNIQETPFKRDYIHLLGHFKRDKVTCIFMALKLKQLYPDFYERVLQMFESKGQTINDLPNKENFGVDFSKLDAYLNNIINVSAEEKTSILEDYDSLKLKIKKHISSCDLDELEQCDQQVLEVYERVFSSVKDSKIIKTKHSCVIQTLYDFGGLMCAKERVGIEYYNNWAMTSGTLYNLLIPECTSSGFTLTDIDEFEVIILEELKECMTLFELKNRMLSYVEDSTDEVYRTKLFQLTEEIVKRLILAKAITCVI